jgi:hypothetical protein
MNWHARIERKQISVVISLAGSEKRSGSKQSLGQMHLISNYSLLRLLPLTYSFMISGFHLPHLLP